MDPSTTRLAKISATPPPGPDFEQVVRHYEANFPPKGHGLAQIGQRREAVPVGEFPVVVFLVGVFLVGVFLVVVLMKAHIDRNYAIHHSPEYIRHTGKPVI